MILGNIRRDMLLSVLLTREMGQGIEQLIFPCTAPPTDIYGTRPLRVNMMKGARVHVVLGSQECSFT